RHGEPPAAGGDRRGAQPLRCGQGDRSLPAGRNARGSRLGQGPSDPTAAGGRPRARATDCLPGARTFHRLHPLPPRPRPNPRARRRDGRPPARPDLPRDRLRPRLHDQPARSNREGAPRYELDGGQWRVGVPASGLYHRPSSISSRKAGPNFPYARQFPGLRMFGGVAMTEETIAALNALLEAERSGAQALRAMLAELPPGYLRNEFEKARRDESVSCNGLIAGIKRLGGTPRRRKAEFTGRGVGQGDLSARLWLLARAHKRVL